MKIIEDILKEQQQKQDLRIKIIEKKKRELRLKKILKQGKP